MPRLDAAKILVKVISQQKSLTLVLKTDLAKVSPQNKPLVQELCFGVLRWYFRLRFIADYFLTKPLKNKDTDVYILILLGIYQLLFTRIPDHAALYETVNAAKKLKKNWATNLINGVLRNFLKNQAIVLDKLALNEEALYAHPTWLIEKFKSIPTWQTILEANNQHPLLCLRVNQQNSNRDDYIASLTKNHFEAEAIPWTQSGVVLKKAADFTSLPGFNSGAISVQDGGAQLAVEILAPEPQERILDACAAPGGKSCHILEAQPNLKELIAIDNQAQRCEKIVDNLNRLKLTAKVLCHDITDLSWWDGQYFDRILLDVPCSATGVIARHPDIKILRQPSDIPSLANVQFKILQTVWQTLKKGGLLLYVTCSVLSEENEQIIAKFLKQTPNCQEVPIQSEWGLKLALGKQIYPGMHLGMDGFYYAKLQKLPPPPPLRVSNEQLTHHIWLHVIPHLQ